MRHSILHFVASPLVLHDILSIPCQISTSKGNKNTRRVMSCGIMEYILETLSLKVYRNLFSHFSFIKHGVMKVNGGGKEFP